jgi:hypothetical protein
LESQQRKGRQQRKEKQQKVGRKKKEAKIELKVFISPIFVGFMRIIRFRLQVLKAIFEKKLRLMKN